MSKLHMVEGFIAHSFTFYFSLFHNETSTNDVLRVMTKTESRLVHKAHG